MRAQRFVNSGCEATRWSKLPNTFGVAPQQCRFASQTRRKLQKKRQRSLSALRCKESISIEHRDLRSKDSFLKTLSGEWSSYRRQTVSTYHAELVELRVTLSHAPLPSSHAHHHLVRCIPENPSSSIKINVTCAKTENFEINTSTHAARNTQAIKKTHVYTTSQGRRSASKEIK